MPVVWMVTKMNTSLKSNLPIRRRVKELIWNWRLIHDGWGCMECMWILMNVRFAVRSDGDELKIESDRGDHD